MHAQTSETPTVACPIEPLLTPIEAAAYMGLAAATLQRQRTDGTGPRFIKRRIAYRPSDLQVWLDGRIAASTSDARVRGLAA
jgi:hypothetical protein